MYRTPAGRLDPLALVAALEAGATLAVLGTAAGVTRERIRQAIRADPVARHRYHVLHPRWPRPESVDTFTTC